MDKQEIIEGNCMIGLFMGAKPYFLNNNVLIFPMFENPAQSGNLTTAHRADELKYNYSWDWLMPVVEKIESLGYDTNIFTDEDGCQCMIWKQGLSYKRKPEDLIIENVPAKRTDKIGIVWKAVIFFIKWFNSQKQ